MLLFVDTSAVVKRYLSEVGSAWVLSWITPAAANIIVVSELTMVEAFSVFARNQRQGFLQPANAAIIQQNFLFHYEKEYLPVPLDTQVLEQARNLLLSYQLRTLDAIQLASAIRAEALLGVSIPFISGDNNLLQAAQAVGFTTDNPYDHP